MCIRDRRDTPPKPNSRFATDAWEYPEGSTKSSKDKVLYGHPFPNNVDTRV